MKSSRIAGFTIVEILIVIVVVALLAGLSVAGYSATQRQAQDASLTSDVANMDKAQKYYISRYGQSAVEYDSSNPDKLLAFRNSEGNSVVVKLLPDGNYCVYGYNPRSNYPTAESALVRPSKNGVSCSQLTTAVTQNPSTVRSTVEEVGRRLEAFKQKNGYYPHLNELDQIGLLIKPNAAVANQQQLYCRNDVKAIYLQVDKQLNVAFVYDTDPKTVAEVADPGKVSLTNTCPAYNIRPTDPGYEAAGIKNPDF